MIVYEFEGAHGGNGEEVSRFYWLAEEVEAQLIQCWHADNGACEYGDTVIYQAIRVDCWPPIENVVAVPAAAVTPIDAQGSAIGGGAPLVAYPEHLTWSEVLDALGYDLVDEVAPIPAPPEPFLVGAVPTADALPSAPVDYGVYLVRDTAEGRCCMAGEWQTAAWGDGCEQAFGPADDIPDLEAP